MYASLGKPYPNIKYVSFSKLPELENQAFAAKTIRGNVRLSRNFTLAHLIRMLLLDALVFTTSLGNNLFKLFYFMENDHESCIG